MGAKGTTADSTLNLADVIDGKEGTDTLQLTMTATPTAAVAGVSISNVEIVNVVVNAATGGAKGVLESATYSGVQQLWQVDTAQGAAAGNYGDVTVAAGVTAGFRSTGAKATASEINAVDVIAASATQKTLAIALDGVGGGGATGDNEILLNGAGVTTVDITGSIVTNAVNELTLTEGAVAAAAAVTTFNIGLSSNTEVLLNAGDFAALKTFNLAGSTGNITADLTGVAATLKTVTGGSGADVLTVDLEAGVTGVKVNAGAGADTVELNAAAAAGIDDTAEVTLGAGKDTLLVTAVSNIATVTAADPTTVAELTETLITVTDFKTSEDVLDLATNGQALTTTQLTNAAAAADLLAATKLVAGYLGAAGAAVFSYGDDAYVFVNNAADATVDNGDGLIKLVGVDATEFANVQNGNLVL